MTVFQIAQATSGMDRQMDCRRKFALVDIKSAEIARAKNPCGGNMQNVEGTMPINRRMDVGKPLGLGNDSFKITRRQPQFPCAASC